MCLDSLSRLTYPQATPVVIDNGSEDDSVHEIRRAYPDVHILELEKNLFYGGGNNAGLKWAAENKFDYIVFLNNDTTVEPDFIEPLINAFSVSEKVGMAGPLMCYSATPQLVWYGGGIVNLWTGRVAHKFIRSTIQAVPNGPKVTDYISGCCMMMSTNLATELEGFDPIFTMYGEDVDLSLRCRKAGYRLIFAPESKIFHKVSASIGGEFSARKIKRKLAGLLQLFARHAYWYQWPGIALGQLATLLFKSRLILKAIRGFRETSSR